MRRDMRLPTDGYWPPRFKPVNGRYAPVVGGRWSVRRDRHKQRPWRAFSHGKASKFNRRFKTFEEAINWAQSHAGISVNRSH